MEVAVWVEERTYAVSKPCDLFDFVLDLAQDTEEFLAALAVLFNDFVAFFL